MHLLAAEAGLIDDGSQAVDLEQTPAPLVALSMADAELALLAEAKAGLGVDVPDLRLANISRLAHPMSVDLYAENVLKHAKLIVARLLGGHAYWPYGVEQLSALAKRHNIKLALLAGDAKPDEELAAFSTLPPDVLSRLHDYLAQGGQANARQCLLYAASLMGRQTDWLEPKPLSPAGCWWPGLGETTPDALASHWTPDAPKAAILFYRALSQSGDTAPIAALVSALQRRGFDPLPIFATSLKDSLAAGLIESLLNQYPPAVILNATGFALGEAGSDPLAACDVPILQTVLASSSHADWRNGTRGLPARDIAMSVALPEIDGRILAGAISFKDMSPRDAATQCDMVRHVPHADGISHAADLAQGWVRLRKTLPADQRIAIVLANYPNRDGRLGNGVGLDTPASACEVLKAMRGAGYDVGDAPQDPQSLMRLLLAGPTNDLNKPRQGGEILPLPDYLSFFHTLPQAVQDAVLSRWGSPEADPFFKPSELSCGGFVLSIHWLGHVAIGVQPARGYNIDPASSYHSPDLAPPHGYLAFYAWLRDNFKAHAVIHLGKHGNLEWLPGKALALSPACFPQAILGPVAHFYPFIVNDPGEGTQAKRRSHAVIIDHLTPPLTRAESYGTLQELEQLVDEYAEAAGLDPRRLPVLATDILSHARRLGLDDDCGIKTDDPTDVALKKLDAHLCDIKELQIRDGLHIFGQSPQGDQRTDLLVSLARTPRLGKASILRTLSDDLGLGFDPLDCAFADDWTGPKPAILADLLPQAWRTAGDAVERLEALARQLIGGELVCDAAWTHTQTVLCEIETALGPALDVCGRQEIKNLLHGLRGGFVPPGPSGAPTRGRPDVLPTGRNFHSVDTRSLPTPAAWHLGWKSASLLIERHLQDHGDWPKAMALSAWGTSCMRTGGDDVAQALALMGVRPCWDAGSGRVSGFEILPLSVLDRPRIDVTLRVSGFFRDAFPGLIDLVDSAVRAVAALDEPETMNPLAASTKSEAAILQGNGWDQESSMRRAASRVFGSKPGAYGAGLQALIDEKGWQGDGDLANAYLAWGGYAYGGGAEGEAARDLFENRLSKVEAVIQNQDNREHDLLDSDDYYQFEGGLAATVRNLSGVQPAIYHPDHSRPETPRIRTLQEELARVVRGRAVNPKWIKGVMRHGYKGAFEMAATVDYLFAFAATARCVSDHHFDALFDAYIRDDAVRDFIAEHNPAALSEMQARFQEAIDRELWHPFANDVGEMLDRG
ncbi:MAG: cobaltochelatase subunit CobN [Alphaproteobacteria bacterium]|nr:cobaltochelatase subunit CobN [Alphaproteobacteria bacterium]